MNGKKDNKSIGTSKLDAVENLLFLACLIILYTLGGNSETSLTSWIFVAIFVFFEFVRAIKLRSFSIPKVPFLLMLAFMAWCFLSSLWAIESPESATYRGSIMFVVIIFFAATFNFYKRIPNGKERLMRNMMIAGAVLAVYVVLYYGPAHYLSLLLSGRRIGAEISHVNTIALQTSLSAVVAFFLGYTTNKLYYLVLPVSLFVALGTGSKKVLIMVALSIILTILLTKVRKFTPSALIKPMIAAVIILFAFNQIYNSGVFDKIFMRFESVTNFISGSGEIDFSTTEREAYAAAGIEQFKKTPIQGIGAYNSGYITEQVSGGRSYLHNNYVELLATLGLVGFSLYYGIWAYISASVLKQWRHRDSFKTLAMILTVVSLVLDVATVSYYSLTTYICFALILLCLQPNEQAEIAKNDDNGIIQS